MDCSRPNGIQPEGSPQGLGTTRTHQTKQPEDLSLPEAEGHPAGFLDALQRRNSKHILAQRARASGIEILNLAPHHDPNEFRIRNVRQRPGGHAGAVTQDREARANSTRFLQEVGDIQQADPLLPQAIEYGEEVLGVGTGEARRRLIENEHPRLRPQGPRDLDELLLGDRQLPGDRVQWNTLGSQMPQGFSGQLPLTRPIHPPPAGGFFAQGDILSHRQVWGQIEFLMNHRHARALGGNRINRLVLRTVEHHGARIRLMDSAQDFEQRTFSRPILPDEGMGLTQPQRQTHPPKRLGGTEGFFDSVEF